MGSGRFDHTTYHAYTARTEAFTRDERFTSRHIHKDLDPKGVKLRESCDSADNPQSNAIIIALDVTGSMGYLAEEIAKKGLGVLFQRILDDKPVSDPHLMFMGIGDAHCDQAPLQVSQFEADNRIVEQLTMLYLEGGGGGNNTESYTLPWYFAAEHTIIDCFEKRGKKGYLFTVGDEEAPGPLLHKQISQFIGDTPQSDILPAQLLKQVQEKYNVYHIIIEEGSYARRSIDTVRGSWNALMGQNALSLKDYKKLGEGIVSIIQMNEDTMGHGVTTKARELPGYIGLLR